MIVLLGERWASDLSMMSPQLAFSRHDVLPEEVNALVDVRRLRKVIPASRNL